MGAHALNPLLPGLKIRVTALHQHDDRLYAGAADGSVRVFSLTSDGKAPELLATYTLARRQIDQLAVLPEARQLAVLADSVVTLHKLDDPSSKTGTTTLTQARYAHTFAVTTYYAVPAPKKKKKAAEEDSLAPEDPPSGERTPAKVQRDLIVIGCRKKVVVYGAGRTLGEIWELALPHSPRTIVFPAPMYADLPGTVHMLYSPQASVLLTIRGGVPPGQRLVVSDLPTTGYPPARAAKAGAEKTAEATGSGFGFGGLGGWVGKGAAIPVGTRTVGGEVLLVRDELGVFFSSEGNYTRTESLSWPTAPEGMAFANPYIYSMLPAAAGTSTQGAVPQPSVQVYLAPTLAQGQTLHLPAPSTGSLTITAVSVPNKSGGRTTASRVLLVSTPTDKALMAAEGSTVWELQPGDIGEQVDALVREGRVTDAIGLVEAAGEDNLKPTQRLPHLRILQGLAQFAHAEFRPALEAFIVHNVHPAKVVALYPKQTISGNLSVPREDWMSLFGAVEGAVLEPPAPPPSVEEEPRFTLRNAHLALGRRRSNETIRSVSSSTVKEKEEPSAVSEDRLPGSDEGTLPREAIDELIYYLSDRRQKLAGAIPALGKPLPAEADLPPLSEVSAEVIHALPNGPLTDLDPEQLLRTAQVIYTSLLKVYLVARPTLVGSLCRIENWVDVAEVEPLLREKGRIDDLRDLYMQKQSHEKALSMLLEQAQAEDDPLDRYPPTIRYLQKLGPKNLQLIFDNSKWIFKEDPVRALQVFTADEPEVDALPRPAVVAFLEQEHWESAIKYLEHVFELGESSAELHDKLAELYLRRVRESNDEDHATALQGLLQFLNTSTHYRAHRLLSKLKPDEIPEVRAVLLGQMGKHDEALRIYVYKLNDYAAAEAYCARVYAKEPDPKGIFLHLLRLYLRPTPPQDVLVDPALALVGRHGKRLDVRSVLDLLPPLVPVKELRDFFQRTLGDERAKRNEHRITKNLLAARKAQVERVVMGLEVKRVRITDQRICPQCQKRLGQSAIAVHAPRGEVTHLHCKDQFSAMLAELRA